MTPVIQNLKKKRRVKILIELAIDKFIKVKKKL